MFYIGYLVIAVLAMGVIAAAETEAKHTMFASFLLGVFWPATILFCVGYVIGSYWGNK